MKPNSIHPLSQCPTTKQVEQVCPLQKRQRKPVWICCVFHVQEECCNSYPTCKLSSNGKWWGPQCMSFQTLTCHRPSHYLCSLFHLDCSATLLPSMYLRDRKSQLKVTSFLTSAHLLVKDMSYFKFGVLLFHEQQTFLFSQLEKWES